MIDTAIIHDARALVLATAPELSAAPLYVVVLPADPSITLRGFCTRSVEAAFRQQLIASGEWAGPGTLIALADGFETDAESVFGVVLHEAAHALPFAPPNADAEPTPEAIAHAGRLLSALVTLPRDQRPMRCPWHGPAFIRTCAHLQYRAAELGIDLPHPALRYAGWEYDCRPGVYFARALGDEPARLQSADFATILAMPAPDEFTAIYGD